MYKIKVVFVAIIGGINAWLGTLAPMVYILLGLNIADYFTGLVAAPYRGEMRNSSKGFRGIAKKISMFVLIGVSMAIDWLLMYAVESFSIPLQIKFLVAVLVTVWLIANEMISILENVADIGVEVPKFLIPVIKWIKEQADERAEEVLPKGGK